MKLLTKANLKALPALGSTDGQGMEAIAQVKYFTPFGQWTWYATEFNPEDGIFFGLVIGFERELGEFALAELEGATGPGGIPLVERDRHFSPTKLSEL